LAKCPPGFLETRGCPNVFLLGGEMQDTLAEYLIEYARSWLRDQELEVHEFSLKYFKREYEIGFGKIMG